MITLAIIGIGAWGKNYISALKSFKDCKIKYLCSSTEETLKTFQGDYVKTTNYKDLLAYKDIDGVIIATPNATHYEIAYNFLKKGVNLLIEKPLVESYSQSLKLKSLQQKTNAKVLIGHTYLFDPAYVKAKELVKSLGKIRYISYEGLNNGPYRANTSTLWDVGPHAVSLCLDIHQKEPTEVSAWALDSLNKKNKLYDFSFIKLKFSDQVEVFIKISWLYPIKKRELIIVGSKNSIMYDAVAEKRITYYKNMISPIITKHKKNNVEISYPSYNSNMPLESEIKEFIDAIRNNKNIRRSSLDFGIRVTRIINLAEQSIINAGKSIKFN